VYKTLAVLAPFLKCATYRSNGGRVIVDKVCDYFGVKIALYFAYLGHYTAALLWPAFLGTIFWLLSGTHQVNRFFICDCVQRDYFYSFAFLSVFIFISYLALDFASLNISFHLQLLLYYCHFVAYIYSLIDSTHSAQLFCYIFCKSPNICFSEDFCLFTCSFSA